MATVDENEYTEVITENKQQSNISVKRKMIEYTICSSIHNSV